MTNFATIEELSSEAFCAAVEANLHRDPGAVALDRRLPSAAAVATQVKYLQRAERKLPSYYAARCIIPPLAFEQSSSEQSAAIKRLDGDRVLELTAGLGVDTLYLSRRFREVVALERDERLAEITRENMRRLGVDNVTIINSSAEDYLATCEQRFDWIYVDPDRRGARGEKLVRLEDCSPNILSLGGDIERLGARLAIKLSPLFDVEECFRLFADAHVEVVSLALECKEVLIYTSQGQARLTATALSRGSVSRLRSHIENKPCARRFEAERYRYLLIPDVALQKSRLALDVMGEWGDIWSNNGFAFAPQRGECAMARALEIERITPYEPKRLRKELAGGAIELMRRDFPLSTAKILSQLKVREGGSRRVAFTAIEGELLTIFLKP